MGSAMKSRHASGSSSGPMASMADIAQNLLERIFRLPAHLKPWARIMRLFGLGQSPVIGAKKPHRCDQGVTCHSRRYSASCRRNRSNQTSPAS